MSGELIWRKNKIEIVAAWFFILGLVDIFITIFFIVAGVIGVIVFLFFLSYPSYQPAGSLPLIILLFIFLSLTIIVLAFNAMLLFRIRFAIRKLEARGYQSALLYLVAILSIILLFQIASKQRTTLSLNHIFLVFDCISIFILFSQRQMFEKHSLLMKSLVVRTVIAITLLLLLTISSVNILRVLVPGDISSILFF